MKNQKIMLSLAFIGIFALSNLLAQDSLKAIKGKWATELNLNLSDADFTLNNLVNQIKLRAFVTNNTALRMAFTIKNYKGEIENTDAYGNYPNNNKTNQKYSLIGLNFGGEGHFKGTRRLSPYLGGEIGFALKKSEEEFENDSYTAKTEGAWRKYELIDNGNGSYTYTTYVENGFTSVGLNAIAGFDFYLDKHFYIGYEFLYGFEFKKYQTASTVFTAKEPDNYTPENSGKNNAKEWTIGPNIVNGIRIGFVF